MKLTLDSDITDAQMQRIEFNCQLLGTTFSDVEVEAAQDLPPDWIKVTIGVEKGRPKTFHIDPEGQPHR